MFFSSSFFNFLLSLKNSLVLSLVSFFVSDVDAIIDVGGSGDGGNGTLGGGGSVPGGSVLVGIVLGGGAPGGGAPGGGAPGSPIASHFSSSS